MPATRFSYLRFVAIMVLYGMVVGLFYREEVLGQALAPLAMLTARATSFLLHAVGIDALRNGTTVMHPAGFSYEIAYTCTGFLPIVTLVVCILAYPGPFQTKCAGILIGAPVLIGINLLRLTSLFYIGIDLPEFFVFAHEVVWEVVWVIAFVGFWFGWIQWASRRACRRPSPANS
ncbi:MAG: archaeosortase [Proteobacteria bacterium]|nr:archaeosortase [Pseudomonadota bacterium]